MIRERWYSSRRGGRDWGSAGGGEGESGRLREGERGRLGECEMGRWGDGEIGGGREWDDFVIFACLVAKYFNSMNAIKSHKELIVYQLAFKVSMEIFNISKGFPREEVYSLTSQILRSSRSVCANLAEAFRKRRYEKAFVSKLSDSESEAAETQVWLDYSHECGYLHYDKYQELINEYEKIIGMLVNMLKHPDKWSF